MEQVTRVRSMVGSLPVRVRVMIVGVVVAAIVILILLTRAATYTNWVTIQSDLQPTEVAKAQDVLAEEGIESQTNDATTEIQVPESDKDNATLALASANLLTGTSDPYQIISENQSLTQTQQDQETEQVQLLEAKAEQLIERLAGIKSAEVVVAQAEDTLFTDEAANATASVSVDTGGAGVPSNVVTSIRQLVANGVPKLNAADVEVVDDLGKSYNGSDDMVSASTVKLQVEERYASQTERKLTENLEKIVGKGNVVVLVKPELDLDKATEEAQKFGREDAFGGTSQGPVGEEVTKDEQLASEGPAAAGTTGATANTTDPQAAATATDGGASEYQLAETTRKYLNDNIVSIIEKAPGALKSMNVTVTYDTDATVLTNENGDKADPGTQSEQEEEATKALEAAVNTYFGATEGVITDDLIEARDNGTAEISVPADAVAGDPLWETPENIRVSVERGPLMDIAEDTAADSISPTTSKWIEYGMWFAVAMVVFALAWLIKRELSNRMRAMLADQQNLKLLESGEPMTLRDLEQALLANSASDSFRRAELQRKVEEIVERQPEDAARLVRSWLNEDDPHGGWRAAR